MKDSLKIVNADIISTLNNARNQIFRLNNSLKENIVNKELNNQVQDCIEVHFNNLTVYIKCLETDLQAISEGVDKL